MQSQPPKGRVLTRKRGWENSNVALIVLNFKTVFPPSIMSPRRGLGNYNAMHYGIKSSLNIC
jgi:hypothetical protein